MSKLIQLRNKIEKMNLIHHVKIFQIVKNHGIDYSENRNGIFFNMNLFNDDCINDINEYIKYVYKQEDKLDKDEKLKLAVQNEFFKDNKEKKENIVYTSS